MAMLLAWWIAAVLNTLLLRFIGLEGVPGLALRDSALMHLYDLGQSMAPGVLIAGGVYGFERYARGRGRLGWTGVLLVAAGLGVVFLRDDLQGPADRLSGGSESLLPVLALCCGMALSVPILVGLTRWFVQRWTRIIPLAGALFAVVANHLILRADYAGAHLLLGTAAACVAGTALAGAGVRRSRKLGRLGWITAVILALYVSVCPPPNAGIASLGHSWARGITSILPRTFWEGEEEVPGAAVVDEGDDAKRKAISSGAVGLLPKDPIIIYYSVDSLRADLLHPRYAKRFPHIHALKKSAVNFTQARAPSTRTTMTLTTVMTGKYAAQLYWSSKFVPEGKGTRAIYAHKDPAKHFPELLAAAGVDTVQYGQAVWLANEFRLTAGFSESVIVPPVEGKPSTKGKWSTGEDVIPRIFARLRQASKEGGPLFLFFHDLDPHSPFDLGRAKKGSIKRRYLSEVKLVDSRIGRLTRLLEQTGLAERTVLILTADHGEGFGEHGTRFHGQHLYDEQLRVPLVIKMPNQAPREIDDYVSLIDMGPTILDLMGQPTPADFLGQSLVPYFRGEVPTFTRPLIFEVRSKDAMLLPNGLKLIRDRKTGAKEMYNLKTDPRESTNLFDVEKADAEAGHRALDAFFKRYTLRRKGYKNRMKR